MHHFVVKFPNYLRLRRQEGIDPPNQNPADVRVYTVRRIRETDRFCDGSERADVWMKRVMVNRRKKTKWQEWKETRRQQWSVRAGWRRETHAVRCSAPLKLRPYGAIQICFYYYYYFKVHQHKATGRKTRLDIQNYAWLQRQFTLLPWCCGKKPHFLFAEPWKGVGKGMLSPWYFLWLWWYACQSLVWAQWPSHAMYQLFLWQMGRRCVYCIIIIISRPWNNDSASLARTGTDWVNESSCEIRGCMRFVHSSAARWYLCSTGRRKREKLVIWVKKM